MSIQADDGPTTAVAGSVNYNMKNLDEWTYKNSSGIPEHRQAAADQDRAFCISTWAGKKPALDQMVSDAPHPGSPTAYAGNPSDIAIEAGDRNLTRTVLSHKEYARLSPDYVLSTTSLSARCTKTAPLAGPA